MPFDTTREELHVTPHQARRTTIAGLICDQVLRVTESPALALAYDVNYDLFIVDSTSASVTIELPPLETAPIGRTLTFYKSVAANSMVIEGNGSEQIQGAANVTRAARYSVVQVTKIETAANTYAWLLESRAVDLADVADAAVARENLGIVQWVSLPRLNVVGASANVYRYVHPTGAPSATLTRIMSALTGALTTGNATITAAINGVAVTNGLVTITQAASAAGDLDSATPTAANVIAAGQVLSFTIGGTNDAAVFADLTFELTY
jgi:hypothetical protein